MFLGFSVSRGVIDRFLRDAIKVYRCLFVPIWRAAIRLESASDAMHSGHRLGERFERQNEAQRLTSAGTSRRARSRVCTTAS